MLVQQVSFSAMAGMALSIVLALGLPAALLILGRKRLGARLGSFLFGCVVYFGMARALEPVLNAAVLRFAGGAVAGSVVLYALYGGLVASLLEEGGRYLALRTLIRPLDRENALMLGAGHGSLESVLLVAWPQLGSLLNAVLINNGLMQQSLDALREPELTATYKAIEPLWTTPAAAFWLAGFERIVILAMHLCLSLLLFWALRRGRRGYLLFAFGAHFAVVAATLLLTRLSGVVAAELAAVLLVAGIVWYTLRADRAERAADAALPAGDGY